MGGLFSDEDDEDQDEGSGLEWGEGNEVVGWKREDLLKEVVVVLGKHRDLQRVTVPYAKLLGVLEGADETGDTAMITDG